MNRHSRALLGGLMVAALIWGGVLAGCTNSAPSPTTPGPAASPTMQPSPSGDDYVEVVYFHRTRRCYSCQYAGDMTQHTLETDFADELANGTLVFKTLDVQDSANAAEAEKYAAYGSSLYVDVVKDGEDDIRHVSEIWYHIGDDEKFADAVKAEIEAALESI